MAPLSNQGGTVVKSIGVQYTHLAVDCAMLSSQMQSCPNAKTAGHSLPRRQKHGVIGPRTTTSPELHSALLSTFLPSNQSIAKYSACIMPALAMSTLRLALNNRAVHSLASMVVSGARLTTGYPFHQTICSPTLRQLISDVEQTFLETFVSS